MIILRFMLCINMTKESDISAQYGANRMMQLLNKLYLGDLEYLDEYSECVKEYLQGCYDENLEKIKETEQMTNKSKTKFSAGDKVIRTENTSGTGDGGLVQVGGVYEVYSVSHNGKVVNLVDNPYSYPAEYFELFIETPQVDFKNMKFRVSSPEHSKEIQEALFEMGYCWRSYGCEVRFTDSFPPCDYLYTDEEGHLWRIDSEEDYLVSSFKSAQEYTIETTKSYKLIPVVTVKQSISINGTVTIDGKTYDKEAVLKRLAELEEVK